MREKAFYVKELLLNPGILFDLVLLLALVFGKDFPAIAQGADPSLIAHWQFDEGAGTTASDSSGNNNRGSLFNGPYFLPNGSVYSGPGRVARIDPTTLTVVASSGPPSNSGLTFS